MFAEVVGTDPCLTLCLIERAWRDPCWCFDQGVTNVVGRYGVEKPATEIRA